MPKKIVITIKDKPKNKGEGVDITMKMEELNNTTKTEVSASQVVFNGVSAVLKELASIK